MSLGDVSVEHRISSVPPITEGDLRMVGAFAGSGIDQLEAARSS